MKRVILVCFVVGMAAGCLKENKVDCRTDGDCRGVRLCRQGECVTPEEFRDDGGHTDVGTADVADDSGTTGDGPTADAGVER